MLSLFINYFDTNCTNSKHIHRQLLKEWNSIQISKHYCLIASFSASLDYSHQQVTQAHTLDPALFVFVSVSPSALSSLETKPEC